MQQEGIEFTESVSIAATHPCLPGHFPGQPVVPGVVLLDRVAARLDREGMGPIQRIASVKFRAPLLPEQEAQMHISVTEGRLRFRFVRENHILVSGEGELV
ncbi:hydroxymyristoyl-ACP dehydratase [Dokdonella sp.]|uniref:hydroxymyristoyl-ACP dehydratase n=1 Tax=Dokdonella sp. TaxID=2291710 RepID=UPI003C5C9563